MYALVHELNKQYFSPVKKINNIRQKLCFFTWFDNYKKRRCGRIANETTLHKRPNDTEINHYRSPYGLQQ